MSEVVMSIMLCLSLCLLLCQALCDFLRENGWKSSLHVLCFSALGCIKDDVYEQLRNIGFGKAKTKELLAWCSISDIIGANYILRHRLKKLNH